MSIDIDEASLRGIAAIEPLEARRLLASVSLLGDLNPAPIGSNPELLVRLGQRVIFNAQTEDRTSGLWATDGTAAGTRLIPHVTRLGTDFTSAVVGESLYFVGIPAGQNPSTTPGTLWKTDGTHAGTVQVADVQPHSLYDLGNGKLIFTEYRRSGIEPLWISDGTAAGTVKVSDVGPYHNRPVAMVFHKKLYFARPNLDSYDDDELWVSDGTNAGTRLYCDISFEFGRQDILEFGAAGGKLFISGSGGFSMLYATDGAAPVKLLRRFSYTHNGSIFMNDIDGVLHFNGQEVSHGNWKSDGTVLGTVPFTDKVPGMGAFMGRLGSEMLFRSGKLLIASDGTDAGTRTVYTFDTSISAGNNRAKDVAVIDGVMYFRGASTEGGFELWRTDGTTVGTMLAADVNAGSAGSSPVQITGLRRRVVFAADTGAAGIEPLVVDPAHPQGARMLYDLPGTADSQPAPILTVGTTHFFNVQTAPDTWELWKTDGIGETVKVKDAIGPAEAAVDYGGVLYYLSDRTLWKSDGTSGGTVALASKATPAGGVTWMAIVDGTLYFNDSRYAGGPYPTGTLYAIDAPHATPRAFAPTGQAGTTIRYRDGLMYFCATYHSPIRYFWYSTDGWTTTLLPNSVSLLWPGPGEQPPAVPPPAPPFADSRVISGTRFYAFDDGVHGTELWIDGTAGAQLLADLYPGQASSYPGGLAALNGRLVFSATTPDAGRELRSLNLRAIFAPGAPGLDHASAVRSDAGSRWLFASTLLDDLRGLRADDVLT
jgi:ELWxxDGT repeat protein